MSKYIYITSTYENPKTLVIATSRIQPPKSRIQAMFSEEKINFVYGDGSRVMSEFVVRILRENVRVK